MRSRRGAVVVAAGRGSRFLVLLLVVLGWTAAPSSASVLQTGEHQASAHWSFVDSTGCIYSDIGVTARSDSQAFLNINVYRATTPGYDQCPDEGLNLLNATGSIAAGTFSFDIPSPSLKTGTLEATIPVTCVGPECPSGTLDAFVSLTWECRGRLVKSLDEAGNRYNYRYGTATGEVLFGGVDLVGDLGPSDPTETNLVLILPPA